MSDDDKKNLGEQEGKSQVDCEQVLLDRLRTISLLKVIRACKSRVLIN